MAAEEPTNDIPGVSAQSPVPNELLCFVYQKCSVMAYDDIVKITVDFYRQDEIMDAKSVIERYTHQRLPKRKGPDKCRNTVEDMVKVCLDPGTDLPVFCAVNIQRLPPVGTEHCDISAILTELQSLRAEVRSVVHLRGELATLRAEIDELKHVDASNKNHTQSQPQNDCNTFAEKVSQLIADPSAFTVVAKNKERRKNVPVERKKTVPVVGISTNNNHVKSVKTLRNVEVFVSRLHPLTTASELIDCVESVKDNLVIEKVVCNKLQSRYESLYTSYHVSICVDSAVLKSAIERYMSPESWPSGVFVKRYFIRKQQDGE